MEGTEPDAEPDVRGASRGQNDPRRDADAAGGGRRAGASTEYAANAEPEPSAEPDPSAEAGTAGDLDPHEPPGQG
jgi:hypothetical protein